MIVCDDVSYSGANLPLKIRQEKSQENTYLWKSDVDLRVGMLGGYAMPPFGDKASHHLTDQYVLIDSSWPYDAI